jgi:D-alanyl-D-alanine carboxypeptidase/D-alanyl-D-alanine-endopeptidase (penicillin-binding protein 4)
MDGTLDKRFLDDLRGRVFAKSGFVNGVSCLSGYIKTRDDQWYAFSILMNGVGYGAKQLQEKIVKAIDVNASRGVAGGM